MIEQDIDILKAFREGRSGGVRLLFDKYYRPLVVYAGHMLPTLPAAEDVVQEFFIRLWEDDYLAKLPPEGLSGYLFNSIRNACYTYVHRPENRVVKVDIDETDVRLEYAEARNREIVERFSKAIASMPAQTAAVTDCILMRDMKYQETAEYLHVSVNTVKSLLKKGVRTLREELKEEYALILYFCKKICLLNHPF